MFTLVLFIILLAISIAFGAKEPRFTEFPSSLAAPKTNLAVNTPALSPTDSTAVSAPLGTNPPAPATTTIAMDSLDTVHKLAIGDRLSFRIAEDEEDPKPLLVTDSGELEVPLVGRFPAVGKTCKELALALKAEFEKEYYYNATVIVAVDLMAKTKGRIYLVGPVREPGPQEIPTDEVLTLSKAILRAGGFSDFADKKSVKVTRKVNGTDQAYVVDVAEILERGRTDKDLPLEPGDLVYIPERLIRF